MCHALPDVVCLHCVPTPCTYTGRHIEPHSLPRLTAHRLAAQRGFRPYRCTPPTSFSPGVCLLSDHTRLFVRSNICLLSDTRAACRTAHCPRPGIAHITLPIPWPKTRTPMTPGMCTLLRLTNAAMHIYANIKTMEGLRFSAH